MPAPSPGVIIRLPVWTRLLELLPNPDEVVEREGPEVFDRMLQDPHIFACLTQRKALLLAKEWEIVPADSSEKAQKVAEFVRHTITTYLDFYRDLEELLSAIEHGYAVSEVVWRLEKGQWIPESLLGHDFRRFGFTPDGTLVLLDAEKGRVKLTQPYKFIVHRNEATPENPYGRSVLTRCYWPWRFKLAGFEFWITLLEKFGVPSLAALFETETTEEKARELAEFISEQLLRITSGGAGALAGVKDLKTLEAKGHGEDFKLLLDLCNTEISKAILGETLTVEVGERGAYAHGKVHFEVLESLIKKDAEALANTLNRTLIKWIAELNFGADAPVPRFRFDFEPVADWEKIKDALDRGVPVSKRALYSLYNLPEPEDESDAFIAPTVAAKAGLSFSESPEGENDFFVRRLPRRTFRPIW
jgi:phage gp29-like protein